jgi:hypothetical protein
VSEPFSVQTSDDRTGSVAEGHPVVGQVLASLDALDDLPVADHVAVLESAHERLQDALADAATRS